MACSDKKFVEYIDKCKDSYEEGENITYQSLMSKAERKYQTRMMSAEWNSLTQEQEEIIALKAKIASLNHPKPKREQHQMQRYKSNKSEMRNNPPRKEINRGKKGFTGQNAWRNNKPTHHEAKTKVVNGSTWHFCTHHQAWGRHPTEKCLKAKSELERPNLEASMAHIGIQDVQDTWSNQV